MISDQVVAYADMEITFNVSCITKDSENLKSYILYTLTPVFVKLVSLSNSAY